MNSTAVDSCLTIELIGYSFEGLMRRRSVCGIVMPTIHEQFLTRLTKVSRVHTMIP
jgi:hypothetical protein